MFRFLPKCTLYVDWISAFLFAGEGGGKIFLRARHYPENTRVVGQSLQHYLELGRVGVQKMNQKMNMFSVPEVKSSTVRG